MAETEITKIGSSIETINFVTLVASSLVLVVTLAWNDLITDAIKVYFPQDNKGLYAKFVYTIVVTIVVLLILRYILTIISQVKSAVV